MVGRVQELASEDKELNQHNALYSMWNTRVERLKPVVKTREEQFQHFVHKAAHEQLSSAALFERAKNDTIQAKSLKGSEKRIQQELAADKAKAKSIKDTMRLAIKKLKVAGALNGPKLLQQARLLKLQGHHRQAKQLMHAALAQALEVSKHKKKMDRLHGLVVASKRSVRRLEAKQHSVLHSIHSLQKESMELKQRASTRIKLAQKLGHEALLTNSTTTALAGQMTLMKRKAKIEHHEARDALHDSFFWKE